MADEGARGAVRSRRLAADEEGGGAVPPRPLHDVRARRAGAPLAGGAAPRRRAALPRGGEARARLDDDGDAGRAVAAPRRGWLSTGAEEAAVVRIAVPSKGRLREPSIALLEDA